VEEDSEAVVLEAAEAVTAALHLLHAQVQAFGGSVGRAGDVVSEDLVSPGLEGVAEADDLGHVVGEAADNGLVEQGSGVAPRVGEVDVADGFLSDNRPWAPVVSGVR
jgi:hypothetical protein